MAIETTEVRRVFDAWVAYRDNPGLCRFNQDRKDLIRRRMGRGYSADDLIVLIRYAHEANTSEARFWRGEDGGRKYLGLDNLLRVTKLADRLERAQVWALEQDGRPPPDDDDPDGGVVLGVVGLLRRRNA